VTGPRGSGQPGSPEEPLRPPTSGAARRRAAPDPLGKRALFWVPPPDAAGDAGPSGARRRPLGKGALFSSARSAPGPDAPPGAGPDAGPSRGHIVVECSRCAAVSRVCLLDFVLYQLPVGWWFPRGRFDRRMTCPACRHRAWTSVTLRWR
jgi:hypothetical protein